MGKLELSPSSSDISDIEDLNTDKTVEETLHTDKNPDLVEKNPDLVDTSSEAPVAAFHQGDDGSPENDQFQVNRNTVAIQITHHSTDVSIILKTKSFLLVLNSFFLFSYVGDSEKG